MQNQLLTSRCRPASLTHAYLTIEFDFKEPYAEGIKRAAVLGPGVAVREIFRIDMNDDDAANKDGGATAQQGRAAGTG